MASASRRSSTMSSSSKSPQQPSQNMWQKTKSNSKAGFDKLWGYADKLGDPVNKLSNKLGSEAFWPTTLDKESEKAARILRSFCKDGFYQEEMFDKPDGPKQKQKVLKKIPPQVIKNAKGLAIFTTMRTGLWLSGAGGSGILVGRKPDGAWSPPVGILLHTAGLGFLVGVDIYDCVLVLNTQEALDAFSKWRCTVGGEISAVAGPAGIGGVVDTEVHKRQAPVFTYLKSRGFYAGVQIDGTVVIERTDEDERFYGSKLTAKEIISGKAQSRAYELEMLMETLKAAEGSRYDGNIVPSLPPPADYEVIEEGSVFGIPSQDDPDPFGVLALQKEGFAITDASTKVQVPTEEFDFKPSINSPIVDTFRKSVDSTGPRDSWRRSNLSSVTNTSRHRYATSDHSTQTDFDDLGILGSPRTGQHGNALSIDTKSHTRQSSRTFSSTAGSPIKEEHERDSPISPPSPVREEKHDYFTSSQDMMKDDEEEKDGAKTPSGTKRLSRAMGTQSEGPGPAIELQSTAGQDEKPSTEGDHQESPSHEHKEHKDLGEEANDDDDDDDDEFDDADDEPVIQEVHQVHQVSTPVAQQITKAKVVSMPKRIPPSLPPRNPGRVRNAAAAFEEKITSPAAEQSTPRASLVQNGASSPEKDDSVNSINSISSRGDQGIDFNSPATSPERPSSTISSEHRKVVGGSTSEDLPGAFPVTSPAISRSPSPKKEAQNEGPKVSLASIRGSLRQPVDDSPATSPVKEDFS